MPKFYAYIVRCRDRSLYIGVTNNLAARIKRHNQNKGAWWVEQHGGGNIIYSEQYDTLASARRREKQLKKWSRIKKEALIKEDFAKLTGENMRD